MVFHLIEYEDGILGRSDNFYRAKIDRAYAFHASNLYLCFDRYVVAQKV